MINLISSSEKIKQSLIASICIGFLISTLLPPVGIIFSIFVALMIVVTMLYNVTFLLPILLIILLISSGYDPHLFKIEDFSNIMNPFHMGLFTFIKPELLLGLIATSKVGLEIAFNFFHTKKISLINGMYILLVVISIITSIMGWQLGHERKFQSLFFLFKISACLWLYRLVLNSSALEIEKIVNSVRNLLIATICLYSINFLPFVGKEHFLYSIGFHSHINYFSMAITVPWVFFIFKYSYGWKKYFLITVFSVLCYLMFFQPKSITMHVLFYSSFLFYFLSSNTFKHRYLYFKLIFFVVVVSQLLIFLTPFLDFNVQEPESYIAVEDVKGYLNLIWYKFSLDRLPLWLGALDAIKESVWIMPAGSTYVPYNFGTFLAPERQIQWSAGAHQMQLELMTNYGLVGAVLYWSIWISFMRKIFLAVNSTMAITRFLSIGLLAYFIFPSYVANFMIQEHATLPWMILGLTMALYQKFK
jgi:hypothetical protein